MKDVVSKLPATYRELVKIISDSILKKENIDLTNVFSKYDEEVANGANVRKIIPLKQQLIFLSKALEGNKAFNEELNSAKRLHSLTNDKSLDRNKYLEHLSNEKTSVSNSEINHMLKEFTSTNTSLSRTNTKNLLDMCNRNRLSVNPKDFYKGRSYFWASLFKSSSYRAAVLESVSKATESSGKSSKSLFDYIQEKNLGSTLNYIGIVPFVDDKNSNFTGTEFISNPYQIPYGAW